MVSSALDPLCVPEGFWPRDDVGDALDHRDIGALFKLLSRHTGASQTRIGTATGLAQGTVCLIMNGSRAVSAIDVLERIADGLAVPDTGRLRLDSGSASHRTADHRPRGSPGRRTPRNDAPPSPWGSSPRSARRPSPACCTNLMGASIAPRQEEINHRLKVMFGLISDQSAPRSLEFIEKKGRGHPDSLADALAEIISYSYAGYCVENFGAILHHYVDKLTLLGGEAQATLGTYTQVRKFRIVLNGRFSRSFGGQEIPVLEIAHEAVKNYLPLVLPQIEDNHWEIVDNTNPSAGSSAKGWHWWAPRGLADLPDFKLRRANDTSLSVANAPHTPLEAAVLEAERTLFDQLCVTGQTGSDVKILASRAGSRVEVTACVPVLASAVASRSDYDSIKDRSRALLVSIFREVAGVDEFELHLNTRDDVTAGDIYLLGLGTALEHGDEGVVGRGNRSNGLINTESPMSLDAPWGKNPVYFTGRVYDCCARAVSYEIWTQLGLPNSVYLASQNGRPLTDPWRAVARIPSTDEAVKGRVMSIATEAFSNALGLDFQLDDIRSRHPHLPVVKTS